MAVRAVPASALRFYPFWTELAERAEGEVDLAEGKLVGDQLSFVETFEMEGNAIRIVYKGTVKGDEIAFARDVGGFVTEQVVARRVKD